MYLPYDYYDTIALHDYTNTVIFGLLLIAIIEIHRNIDRSLKQKLSKEMPAKHLITPVLVEDYFCPKCGVDLIDKTGDFCSKCGAPIK